MRHRFERIDRNRLRAPEVQEALLRYLLRKSQGTRWGKLYGYKEINNHDQFVAKVPLQNYEDVEPWITSSREGEQNLLWPTEIKWFAKSSGTTNAKSKFLPVSQEAIEHCHFKGGRDLLAIYCDIHPETKLFTGRSLRLGGSTTFNSTNHETYYGDLSAILIENMPFWVEMRSTPNQAIALMEEWECKIDSIAKQSIQQNVTSLFGVPSWMLVLSRRILEMSGAQNLKEVWPNLELYAHGGVSFLPYRKQFQEVIGKEALTYMETYNASEGFFAIQDDLLQEGMLLLTEHGIYYEFIPMDQFKGTDSITIPLSEVKVGEHYALVISTNSGLWRYIIGDTVKFTSTSPYRIVITGRTKLFINAFGEELIIENAEMAVAQACNTTGATVKEYTAAPVYMDDRKSGAHEWIFEFEQSPSDIRLFKETLDHTLKQLNSDYEAKRHKNMALNEPIIHVARPNLFHDWLKERGKLGGQHKVPRLANDRDTLEQLLKLDN